MKRRTIADWDDDEYREWFCSNLVEDEDGCLLWKGFDSRVHAQVSYGPRRWQPHQVAFILAYGPCPEGLQVNHNCDKHNCCHPRCLYAGTAKQNVDDMMERGRWVGNYYQQGKGPHNSIGTKRTPEQRANIAAGVKEYHRLRKLREAQGGG